MLKRKEGRRMWPMGKDKRKIGNLVVKMCKETARIACGMASYWGPYQMKEPCGIDEKMK